MACHCKDHKFISLKAFLLLLLEPVLSDCWYFYFNMQKLQGGFSLNTDLVLLAIVISKNDLG